MSAARTSIGSYCLFKSTKYILDKCAFIDVDRLIILSSLQFFFSLTLNNGPRAILDLFRPHNERLDTFVFHPKIMAKSALLSKSCIYACSSIFNSLPNNIKSGKKSNFSKNVKHYLNSEYGWEKVTNR